MFITGTVTHCTDSTTEFGSLQTIPLCEERVMIHITKIIANAKQATIQNQFRKAKALYQVALNLWVMSILPENQILSELTASLAEIEFLTEDYQRAEDLLSWSLKIDADKLGTSHAQYLKKVDQFSGLAMARQHRMISTFRS